MKTKNNLIKAITNEDIEGVHDILLNNPAELFIKTESGCTIVDYALMHTKSFSIHAVIMATTERLSEKLRLDSDLYKSFVSMVAQSTCLEKNSPIASCH